MSPETLMRKIVAGTLPGRSILWLFSQLYRAGVLLRSRLYDMGIFPAHGVSIPVVSIGNITSGGTGKTLLVRLLADELASLNVAILSRGYRSRGKGNFQVSKETDVALCGDEPLWLAQKLPFAQIWVGKSRLASAQLAQQNKADIVLLDDGMQHRRLKRDFEIAVVDGKDPLGGGFFLPRGFLRDAPQRLATADLIVVVDPASDTDALLHRWTAAPIVQMRRQIAGSFENKRLGVFCALGQPQQFVESVRNAGGHIAATFFKPDHHPFSACELAAFAKTAPIDLLVCTEKDGIKLPQNLSLPLAIVPCTLEIVKGDEAWKSFLTQIKKESYDRRISNHTS